jgi:hypothetical protein
MGIESNHPVLFWNSTRVCTATPSCYRRCTGAAIVLTNHVLTNQRCRRRDYERSEFSCVLGMLSSLEVKVLCPT